MRNVNEGFIVKPGGRDLLVSHHVLSVIAIFNGEIHDEMPFSQKLSPLFFIFESQRRVLCIRLFISQLNLLGQVPISLAL